MNKELTIVTEIADILLENYYSLGVGSGHEALGNFFDDFHAGRLNEFIAEMEITVEQLWVDILPIMSKELIESGAMWTPANEFYQKMREAGKIR